MLEQVNPLLRLLCLLLAGLFIFQASRVAGRRDALSDLNLTGLGMALSPVEEPKTATTNKTASSSVSPAASRKPVELSPAAQARVDRIVESEILGSITRPLPMALLGIAGDHAFLRGPNGQTGLVKEGEEIDGIKLLKIGANRVLVEQDKEKKELMIFSGFGSESLLPKGDIH